MTVKQNNYSVKFANLSNISLFDKLAKEYLLMKEVEKLEKEYEI